VTRTVRDLATGTDLALRLARFGEPSRRPGEWGALHGVGRVKQTPALIAYPKGASELAEQLARRIEEPAGRTGVRVPVIRDPPHPAIQPVPLVAVSGRGDALEVLEQPGLHLGVGVPVDPPHHHRGRADQAVGHPALLVLEEPRRHLLRSAQEAVVLTH
jgi:hypothetical protein